MWQGTKHLAIDAWPQLNNTEDRLQGLSRWEWKQWQENDTGLMAMFNEKEREKSLFFEMPPPASVYCS